MFPEKRYVLKILVQDQDICTLGHLCQCLLRKSHNERKRQNADSPTSTNMTQERNVSDQL